MNLRVPIQDAIAMLVAAGLALSPWPWTVLLWAGGWLLFVAILVDARTPAQAAELGSEPATGSAGEVKS